MSTERIATLKRERGSLAIDKKCVVLKLRKDADRKRLFYSLSKTLLSMIGGKPMNIVTIATSQSRDSSCQL